MLSSEGYMLILQILYFSYVLFSCVLLLLKCLKPWQFPVVQFLKVLSTTERIVVGQASAGFFRALAMT